MRCVRELGRFVRNESRFFLPATLAGIALRVAMGALLKLNDAPAGNIPFHDAILQQDSDFDGTFPYMKSPNAGTP